MRKTTHLLWLIFILILMPISYGALDDNLTLYVNFNTASNFTDLATDRHNGTNHGTTFVSNAIEGEARHYVTGSSQYVNYTNPDPTVQRANSTISVWFNTSTYSAETVYSEGNRSNDLFLRMIISVGRPYFQVRGTVGTVTDTDVGGAGLDDEQWHHWVVRRINATFWEHFIDGVNTDNVSGNPGLVDANRQCTGVTCRGAMFGYYTGDIDHLCTWNRTVTYSEVADLYNGGNSTPCIPAPTPPATPVLPSNISWEGIDCGENYPYNEFSLNFSVMSNGYNNLTNCTLRINDKLYDRNWTEDCGYVEFEVGIGKQDLWLIAIDNLTMNRTESRCMLWSDKIDKELADYVYIIIWVFSIFLMFYLGLRYVSAVAILGCLLMFLLGWHLITINVYLGVFVMFGALFLAFGIVFYDR